MSLDRVRGRYLELNGAHPMTEEDDRYVRAHFVEVPDRPELRRDEILDLMAEGRLPLPSYLLSDGTPMVHPDFLDLVHQAGSVDDLEEWFVGQWPADRRAEAEEEWSDGYLSGQYVCLWSVTPTTIQAKTEAIEAIKAEVAALEGGAGSLEELARRVDALDRLEPPFTHYDLLRFGGPTSRQVWIDQVRDRFLRTVSS